MSWQEWVRLGLTGTVGAALGLVGVYIAFRLSSTRDAKVARETRTAQSVANMVTASWDLQRRLATWRFVTAPAAVIEFVHAAQLFAVREVCDHPAVTAWVLRRAEMVTAMLARRPGSRAPLWMRTATMREIAEAMGETTGQLTNWVAGTRSDEWFAARTDGELE